MFKHLALPLVATGWKNTLVNDGDGNTIMLMPNGHKGLEAVQEATALFAAAPAMLPALILAESFICGFEDDELQEGVPEMLAAMRAAIAQARGEPIPSAPIADAPHPVAALDALIAQIVETSAYDDAKRGDDPGLFKDVENARAASAAYRGQTYERQAAPDLSGEV